MTPIVTDYTLPHGSGIRIKRVANRKAIFEYSSDHENLLSNNLRIYIERFFRFDCKNERANSFQTFPGDVI